MNSAKHISYMEIGDGVIIVGYTGKGRMRKLIDLRFRMKFFLHEAALRLRCQRSPWRLIKSLRDAYTLSLTFDKNFRQGVASASGPTNKVGKEGDRGDSPLRCETMT
ncbi:MAG: hypothetical protein ACI305_07345 [Lepagella sp.]